MAMLMRQESVRASFTASPRSRPPKSPGAKASALSRTASVASATVLGTPPARVAVRSSSVEAFNESPRLSSSEISSEMLSPGTMLPSLPTPTAEIPSAAFNASVGPGPSPGKAAREACEKDGVSPTAAVADAVARATPGSVETRRGRSSRSPTVSRTNDTTNDVGAIDTGVPDKRLVSPRSVPLPKTPFGEPRSFATPAALSAVTPIAPNAARRIATPGKGKGGSPLSVFARMMAKVIVDAADEQKQTPKRTSAAESATAALADTPEK